ncbi:MAG: trigger factor [Bacteroidales bacterium]|nr:trigger factor [Bacteroidales bacterium]
MNISRENVDALNAVITLNIEQADYEAKVAEAIKSYAKKVNIPGFRPGKAPVSLVKKQVGKAILAEEVNKIIDEALNNYIKDNNLNLVGQPLPSEGQEPIDFDKEVTNITYKFDLGLAPKVEIDLSKVEVPYYTIEISDEDVDMQAKSLTSRFGSQENVEKVGDKSMVKGSVKQEGGFSNDSAVMSTSVIKDEAEKAKFTGKKVGDVVKFDLKKAYPNDVEISYMLGISKEEAANVAGEYEFTITEITEFKDPELTQEIFDKVLGEGQVKSAEEFKAKVKELISEQFEVQQNYLFGHMLRKTLVAQNQMELPEAFMKRWLTAVNHDNKAFTPDVLEKEFPQLLDEYRWTDIRQSISEANGIKINEKDVMNYAMQAAKSQFAQYGMTNIPDEYLSNYAQSLLKDAEQREQMVMGAINETVVAFAKTKVKLVQKTTNRKDFGKLFED